MTAKAAIKARCLDCYGPKCDSACFLFGFTKPQAGVNRIEAIRQYCSWCMHRNPVQQCASHDCSIYQYRAAAKGNISVSFLPTKPPEIPIDDNDGVFHEKIMVHRGVEHGDRGNVHNDDLGRVV